jgi:hypothetical protein
MRIFLKAMMIVLLATPAYSQGLNMNLAGGPGKLKTMEQVQQEMERDNAYQSAIKKLPNQNTKTDPWGNIRGAAQSSQTQSRSGTR